MGLACEFSCWPFISRVSAVCNWVLLVVKKQFKTLIAGLAAWSFISLQMSAKKLIFMCLPSNLFVPVHSKSNEAGLWNNLSLFYFPSLLNWKCPPMWLVCRMIVYLVVTESLPDKWMSFCCRLGICVSSQAKSVQGISEAYCSLAVGFAISQQSTCAWPYGPLYKAHVTSWYLNLTSEPVLWHLRTFQENRNAS